MKIVKFDDNMFDSVDIISVRKDMLHFTTDSDNSILVLIPHEGGCLKEYGIIRIDKDALTLNSFIGNADISDAVRFLRDESAGKNPVYELSSEEFFEYLTRLRTS